jgi:transposase-like protein
MSRRKNTAKKLNLKEIIGEQDDLLRELVQHIVQQVLEAEMDEAVGAEKGERTPSRLGYRSGYYSRTLTTRVGSWNCGCRRTDRAGFGQRCSSVTNAARRHWSARWPRCTSRACRHAK